MDLYHYRLDVYTHSQHTFMFKHVKVNYASNDPFNHSVLNGSEEGSLWRLLCSFEHLKTQHLLCLFGDDKLGPKVEYRTRFFKIGLPHVGLFCNFFHHCINKIAKICFLLIWPALQFKK